ncbi:signal peptide peptidase SppA [Parashewanella curva]|uniref:Signal peptide peptidase SppA n=1 Tax=Parashewanella curva TaxID=2338552 RepID=A0A3L8Q0T7_9GAMM|nr:signal peptide peptidase SppA [Parashewanella curva]RLV61205.1 signal peptide peptidase SppA [Parashewanella curva]
MSSTQPSAVKSTFKFIWNVINFTRQFIINLVFFFFLFIALIGIIAAVATEEKVHLAPDSALVLDISGRIVDQKQYVDPIETIVAESRGQTNPDETLLSDILYAVDSAANDKRINTLVLDLSDLKYAETSKLEAIGKALQKFRDSGKPIVSFGNYYNQQQYLLASYANKIYLNPQGMIALEGLGRYRLYYKSALEKLKIKTHVFRVGTFKSAVEPYLRDDMSPAAKEANEALLSDIWNSYTNIVASNRNIKANQVLLEPKAYLAELNKVGNDDAKLALKRKLVDELATIDQFRTKMINEVGQARTGQSFKQVDMLDYLKLVKPKHSFSTGDSVAIIVAKGVILDGNQKPGNIGGTSTAKLIRKARFDDNVKAVVLRVDSPGGSAFASEQIRQQIVELKKAGKPVVVSMGSYAASGGYWISASADYIYSTPTTLTGSIGIFGMFNTFEDSLSYLGIHADGVSTSEWAGLSAVRGITPDVARVIQKKVEFGYHKFISLVANERHMSLQQVDKIAQGRVWSGSKALKLGLVDAIGDMNTAITKAAELANLDNYHTKEIKQELSAEEALLQEMFAKVSVYLPQVSQSHSPVDSLLLQVEDATKSLKQFNDPNHLYMLCEECSQ